MTSVDSMDSSSMNSSLNYSNNNHNNNYVPNSNYNDNYNNNNNYSNSSNRSKINYVNSSNYSNNNNNSGNQNYNNNNIDYTNYNNNQLQIYPPSNPNTYQTAHHHNSYPYTNQTSLLNPPTSSTSSQYIKQRSQKYMQTIYVKSHLLMASKNQFMECMNEITRGIIGDCSLDDLDLHLNSSSASSRRERGGSRDRDRDGGGSGSVHVNVNSIDDGVDDVRYRNRRVGRNVFFGGDDESRSQSRSMSPTYNARLRGCSSASRVQFDNYVTESDSHINNTNINTKTKVNSDKNTISKSTRARISEIRKFRVNAMNALNFVSAKHDKKVEDGSDSSSGSESGSSESDSDIDDEDEQHDDLNSPAPSYTSSAAPSYTSSAAPAYAASLIKLKNKNKGEDEGDDSDVENDNAKDQSDDSKVELLEALLTSPQITLLLKVYENYSSQRGFTPTAISNMKSVLKGSSSRKVKPLENYLINDYMNLLSYFSEVAVTKGCEYLRSLPLSRISGNAPVEWKELLIALLIPNADITKSANENKSKSPRSLKVSTPLQMQLSVNTTYANSNNISNDIDQQNKPGSSSLGGGLAERLKLKFAKKGKGEAVFDPMVSLDFSGL